VQGLVYIFIALAALGVAAAAYFGFTFTPIEALVTAVAFGAVAVLFLERQLRQRAEARLERAIEDLARLLSTDAQAGQVLSQRINQLADSNAGGRLDSIEADISVLGTVVRQLAEAVAEMDEAQKRGGAGLAAVAAPVAATAADDDALPEPVIPIELLKQALDENRLVCHIEPIVQLPQRRPHAYDIVPRLLLEDAELADPADFMPRRGHGDVIRRIEALALEETVTIVRRARTAGSPLRLFAPLTRDTIADPQAVAALLATLDANRAIAGSLGFALAQSEWKQLLPSEKLSLSQMNREGIGFSLLDAHSLRFDFGELEGLGFSSVRVDATRLLRNPQHFTDFHLADVAPYARRFHIDVVATGLVDEQQLLSLFEEGIGFVQGPHIARPGPVRPDLVLERGEPMLRRVLGAE
jgi:cyclic-di-GMP phosphodiesterase TipF (flagellum assembly factor)